MQSSSSFMLILNWKYIKKSYSKHYKPYHFLDPFLKLFPLIMIIWPDLQNWGRRGWGFIEIWLKMSFWVQMTKYGHLGLDPLNFDRHVSSLSKWTRETFSPKWCFRLIPPLLQRNGRFTALLVGMLGTLWCHAKHES